MTTIKRISRIIGKVNGKRIKTTANKWRSILSDGKNRVSFKEDVVNKNPKLFENKKPKNEL